MDVRGALDWLCSKANLTLRSFKQEPFCSPSSYNAERELKSPHHDTLQKCQLIGWLFHDTRRKAAPLSNLGTLVDIPVSKIVNLLGI